MRAAAINIRHIHAAVSADEAVAGLCDEHALGAADHAPALSERKLDDTGVKAVLLGQETESSEGRIVASSTIRPSALETILCLMTRMSPCLRDTR